MNQWISIAKLVGKTASAVVALFQNWQDQRLESPDDPTLISSEQWPAESRQAMIRLTHEIRRHATEPPVVFFVE